MTFTSFDYYLFLAVLFLLYYATPLRWRTWLLLIASLFFYYSWNPQFILIIAASIAIDYSAGIMIHQAVEKKRKQWWLGLSVVSNLGLLFFFKYYNFFITNILALVGVAIPEQSAWITNWVFPVGISFYTFQTLSYTLDIYRGYRKPAKNLLYFSLYVTFFPQLLAGPIERSRLLLPQLEKAISFKAENVSYAFRMIIWGLFKKMVVGDRLGEYVDLAFDNPLQQNGSAIFVATVLFSIQLYCDFSAYVDIARGSARLFGIKLSRNFDNRVYFPRSRTHFWQGWHVTLTHWFRDYLYVSVLGKSRSKARLFYGVFIVFLLTGIWHGAAWGFIIWGMISGVWFLLERVTLKWRIAFLKAIRIWQYQWLVHLIGTVIYLSTSITTVLWFRAESFEKGWLVFKSIFTSFDITKANILANSHSLYISLFTLLIMDVINYRIGKQDFGEGVGRWPLWQRWIIYFGLIELIFLFGKFESVAFYYFQF